MTPPPAYWLLVLRSYLGVEERLARRLWQVYAPGRSQTMCFHLRLCEEYPTLERQRKVFEMICPADLLRASQKLTPQGRRRKAEVVELDERILRRTSATGTWL